MKNRNDIYSHFAQIEIAGEPEVTGNGIQIKPAATTVAPTITAVGDDTNVSLKLVPKGTGTIDIGAFHSTLHGSGETLSPTGATAAFRVYADDNNAALTPSGSVPDLRAGIFRTLIVADQSGVKARAWGLMGQAKIYDGLFNNEQLGGVNGRLEIVQGSGTTTLAGNGISAGVCGTLATAGTTLVNTSHIAAAVAAIADIKGTCTQTGKVCGVYVGEYDTTNWSDATTRANFTYGVYVDPLAVTRGITVGTLASTVGSGVPASGATVINGFYSDAAANLAAGVNRNVLARTYIDATQSTAASDYMVIRGHLKSKSGIDYTGDTSIRAAIHGYCEQAGATTVGAGSFFTPVLGELWSDGNLVGTGLVGGLMARIYTSAGSVSGTVAGVVVCKQWASTQTFTHGLYVQDGSVATGNDIRLMGGATISSGSGVPGHSAVQGSLYIRTGQTVNEILYLNTNGTTGWTKLGAVA